jgi:hypothetical protein
LVLYSTVRSEYGTVQYRRPAALIDEYRLVIFPVTVGLGKRLFTLDAPPAGYGLITSRTTSAGAIYVELSPTAFQGDGAFTVPDGKEAVTA